MPEKRKHQVDDTDGTIRELSVKEFRAPASREWLSRQFRTRLDEMGAFAVQGQGWTEEEILTLQRDVDKWNSLLGLNMRLRPFKKQAKPTGRNKPITQTCCENGVLYLNRFGPNYMHCLDIFIAHEGGHMLEMVDGGFNDSPSMRLFRNTYRNAGMIGEDGYGWNMNYSQPLGDIEPSAGAPLWHESMVSMNRTLTPPSGVPSWHDRDVRNVLEGLDGHIGYGFRQIYCDSVAFQKSEAGKIDLRNLAKQYLTYIELEKESIDDQLKKGGKIEAASIPEIARLAAGAWTMGVLAADILHDNELSHRANNLVSVKIKRISDEDPPPKSLDAIIDGLPREQQIAAVVITQSYKEHFVASLGIPSLFAKERMEPHLDRLDPSKNDTKTRFNEIVLIGLMRDGRFSRSLNDLYKDIPLKGAVVWALGRIGSAESLQLLSEKHRESPNIWSESLFTGLFRRVRDAVSTDRNSGMVLDTIPYIVEVMGYWTSLDPLYKPLNLPPPPPSYRNDLYPSPTTRIKKVAFETYSQLVYLHENRDRVLDFLPEMAYRLYSNIGDISNPESIWLSPLDNFKRIVKDFQGNQKVLACLPKFVDLMNLQDQRKKQSGLYGFEVIAEGNPGNPEVLKYLPKIVDYFYDPSSLVNYAAMRTWRTMVKANPGNPIFADNLRAEMLLSNDDSRLVKSAIDEWILALENRVGDEKVMSLFPQIISHLISGGSELRSEALRAWAIASEILPNHPLVIESTTQARNVEKELRLSGWVRSIQEHYRTHGYG